MKKKKEKKSIKKLVDKIKNIFKKKEEKHFCKYCNKRIRAKKSIQRGSGCECFKKHLREETEKFWPKLF